MPSTDDATKQDTVRCSTCGAEIDERAEICPECGTRQRSPPDSGDDRSLLGALLSVPVPGLGQIINRQFGRGLLFMAAVYGGYFLFNTIFGFLGVFEFLLFGVWVYAVYDAYVKGWESDEREPAREDVAAGGTADAESTETTSASERTAGSAPDGSAGAEAERSGATAASDAADAGERTAIAEGSTADSESVEGTTEGEMTADSTATAGEEADDAATESGTIADHTTPDDGDDGDDDEPAVGDRDADEGEEDGGSKWSRDESERSWSGD